MKKIFSILLTLSVLAGFSTAVSSCLEQPAELIEEIEFGSTLSPTGMSMVVSTATGRDVTFSWNNSRGATHYVLEVYEWGNKDVESPYTEVFESDVEPTVEKKTADEGSKSSVSLRLNEDKFYYARVMARTLDSEGNPVVEDSKWSAFTGCAETYLKMETIPSFGTVERTTESITLQWTIAKGDNDGITAIRISPDPTDPSSNTYKSIDITEVTPTEGGVYRYTVTGLASSTKYTFGAYFRGGNRGNLEAWTRPAYDAGATVVDNSEKLVAALKDGASEIVVKYSEEPYVISSLNEAGEVVDQVIDLTKNDAKSIKIYGEGNGAGEMPTVVGRISLPDGLTDFHIEGLNFDGDDYAYDRVINIAKGFATATVNNISMLNCNINGYKSGVYYDDVSSSTFENISFKNLYVTDTKGDGGDGIDMRKGCTINKLSITESTFTSDFRVFLRDDGGKIGNLTVSNNTFCNFASTGSNKGVFDIQADVTSFVVNSNLFLNITGEKNRLIRSRTAGKVPTVFSGNYCYNVGEEFWTGSEAQEAVLEPYRASTTTLTSDPCQDSPRNILNVNNADILKNQAGDPRWLLPYVPQEDPDLEPVAYGHAWDLTDDLTFYSTIDANAVRGNLQLIATADAPINVTDEGMEFTGTAALGAGDIPASSAIGFLVNGPGSIYASTLLSGTGTVNDHITVAVAPANGGSATVVGALHAGAIDAKVVFEDVTADNPQIIYLYSCGPIILSALEWSSDLSSGIMPIDAPTVTPAPGEGTLSIAWNAVDGANGYIISFGAKEPDAEYGETEYTIPVNGTSYTWKDFPSGTWTVNVQAIAAEPTKAKNSNIAGTSVTVTAPAQLPQLSSGTITQEDMAFLYAVTGGKSIDGTNITSSIYYKGFLFTGRNGKVAKFNKKDAYGTFFNTGGYSDYTADNAGRTIRFVAGGAGKLTYVTCANSNSQDRNHLVVVNHDETTAVGTAGNSKAEPAAAVTDWTTWTCTAELSTVAGDVIDLGGASSSGNVNFISVTWEPSGALPADGTGLAPVITTKTWSSETWTALDTYAKEQNLITSTGSDIKISGDTPYYVTDNLMMYSGGDSFKTDADLTYLQMGGSSFSSKESVQVVSDYKRRFLRFRVGGNGKLTVAARGTGGGQAGRLMYIAVGGETDKVGVGTFQGTAWAAGGESNFDNPHTWDITASNGDAITILVTDGIRIQSVTWTPAE